MKNYEELLNEEILLAQYDTECADIALQCEEEGLPAHGSTYDCRCASLWEDYYLPDLIAVNPERWDPDYLE